MDRAIALVAFFLVPGTLVAAPPPAAVAQECPWTWNEFDVIESVTISAPSAGDAPILDPAYRVEVPGAEPFVIPKGSSAL
jgi:hypothetical protein